MKINIKLYLTVLLMCGIAEASERKDNEAVSNSAKAPSKMPPYRGWRDTLKDTKESESEIYERYKKLVEENEKQDKVPTVEKTPAKTAHENKTNSPAERALASARFWHQYKQEPEWVSEFRANMKNKEKIDRAEWEADRRERLVAEFMARNPDAPEDALRKFAKAVPIASSTPTPNPLEPGELDLQNDPSKARPVNAKEQEAEYDKVKALSTEIKEFSKHHKKIYDEDVAKMSREMASKIILEKIDENMPEAEKMKKLDRDVAYMIAFKRKMKEGLKPKFHERVIDATIDGFAGGLGKSAADGVAFVTQYAATKVWNHYFPDKEKEAYARAMAEKEEAIFQASLMGQQAKNLLNRTEALTKWCANAKELMAQSSPEERKMLQKQGEMALMLQMQEIIQGTSQDVIEAMMQEQRKQENAAHRVNFKQQPSSSASPVDLKKSNTSEPQTLAEALGQQGA